MTITSTSPETIAAVCERLDRYRWENADLPKLSRLIRALEAERGYWKTKAEECNTALNDV